MYSTHQPSQEHLERLGRIHPSLKITVAETEEVARENVDKAEVIFGHRYLKQCLPQAKNLRWVQTTAGGVDRLPCLELAERKILLTRMTLTAPVIARHGVTLAWAMVRCLPDCWHRQSQGIWEPSFQWLPFPHRAIVLGTGSIGRAIAKILQSDGIETIGVKRSLNGDSRPEFDRLYDRIAWRQVLPEVDWCFLALPHTPETQGMVDETVLRTLPRHGIVVNVGRGETLVTQDLCRILQEGYLGGAALDVVHPKPTGPEDPIWKTPRLSITPYVAAHYAERNSETEQFCEGQLIRYVHNQELLNLVELEP